MLEVRALGKSDYRGALIRNVNITLRPGEIFALVGEPNSGKSLLSRLILQLATKTKGTIIVKDEKTMGAFLPAANLFLHDTVAVAIKDYCRLNRVSFRPKRAKNILALFNLRAQYSSHIGDLTISQRDRLKLALLLLVRPEIMVLDAPFTNLTTSEARDLRVILKKIGDELKTAILITARKMAEIEEFCDTIGIIDNGVLIAVKSYNEMIAKEIDTAKLAITVAQPNYAAILITQEYDVPAKVYGDQVIVDTKPENVQVVVDFLAQHKVRVLAARRAYRSLEFQYLDLIRGHRNYY